MQDSCCGRHTISYWLNPLKTGERCVSARLDVTQLHTLSSISFHVPHDGIFIFSKQIAHLQIHREMCVIRLCSNTPWENSIWGGHGCEWMVDFDPTQDWKGPFLFLKLSCCYFLLRAQLKLLAAEKAFLAEMDYLSFCLARWICEEIVEPWEIRVFGIRGKVRNICFPIRKRNCKLLSTLWLSFFKQVALCF